MCDSLCLLNNEVRERNITYFAKNSDRDPNEMQLVEFYPRVKRSGKLRATHAEVDYDDVTNAIVISRPYWMWGAEMGINEYGVAIGNEAIFTSGKHEKSGLLGMDLLRLSLESGKTAKESSDIIIDYLERYGQGGTNSIVRNEYYNNSFLITDWQESYVLDTVGKEWVRSKIEKYDSISNTIIPSDRMEKIDSSNNFEIKQDMVFTRLGKGETRVLMTREGLKEIDNSTTPLLDVMKLMRTHSTDNYQPRLGSNDDVCMHAGPLSRRTQTVNSMVTEIGRNFSISWFTFSSNPCVSLYKPIIFYKGSFIGSTSYEENYWKSSEQLHRRLTSSDKEAYSSAMDSVKRAQEKAVSVTENLRAKLVRGDDVSEDEADQVYQTIKTIDRTEVDRILENATNSVEKARSMYDHWWLKKTKNLKLEP